MTIQPVGILASRQRADAVSLALRLERITIAWMSVEALAAIGAGVVAHSTLLLAFGVDSVIELASAAVLYRRLWLEARGGSAREVEAIEAATGKISGALLFVLAACVVGTSIYRLLHRGAAAESYVGLVIAAIAAVGMPILARAKIRVADQIGSRALRADAVETFTCGYMSWILLVGLGANALLHWWWLDSAGAFVLVPFLIKEGREAYTGRCACSDEGCASGIPPPR